jgi:hypothetical protein
MDRGGQNVIDRDISWPLNLEHILQENNQLALDLPSHLGNWYVLITGLEFGMTAN